MKKIVCMVICLIMSLCMNTSMIFAEEETEITTEFMEQEQNFPVLKIDNIHCYAEMEQSYSEGYEPQIIGDYAIVILPLICEAENPPSELRASVNLGDISSAPFVVKNYENTLSYAFYTASDGSENAIYLADFWLPMKAERYNGTYPVSINIEGENVNQSFQIYVNISDGIERNTEPVTERITEEPIILQPELLVSDSKDNTAKAGEIAEAHAVIKNMSKNEAVKNLTVKVSADSENLILQDLSDTQYIEYLENDGETELIFHYRINPDTPSGKEKINLQYSFFYGKGMSGTGSGTIGINVQQETGVEFVEPYIPKDAVVSDDFEVNFQVMNLGKNPVRNVRAEIECDGLIPSETAFIGELSGGCSESKSITVRVTSKSGGSLYGESEGMVRYYYTDDSGEEYTETHSFSIQIKSPFREKINEEPKQSSPKYWIYIVSAILVLIIISASYLFIRFRRRGEK